MASSKPALQLGDDLANKGRRQANLIGGGFLVLTIAAIGLVFIHSDRSLKDVEQQDAKVDKELADATKTQIQQFQQMQEKQRAVAHQAELTATLMEKVPRSILLAQITNSLPANVSLLDLELDSRTHQTPTTGALQTASLKITGLAAGNLQVAELIRNLNSAGLFKDVKLIVSDAGEKDHLDAALHDDQARVAPSKFEVEMTIDPRVNPQSADAPLFTASIEK